MAESLRREEVLPRRALSLQVTNHTGNHYSPGQMVEGGAPLRKLQLLEYKILLELKRICEKHHIKYFLMGGTLLGAVRHNGFIPWDDDIDIGMMREEYYKFITICRDELSQDFFLQTYDTDSNYANPYAKLRLNGTVFTETESKDSNCHNGIYIDIFPFDHIPDNRFIRKMHLYVLSEISTICQIMCGYRPDISQLHYSLLSVLPRIIKKKSMIRIREYFFQRYNKRQTRYLVNGSFYCYPSTIFDTFSELMFEGINFPVPVGYRNYLECAYGNYMSLPPENERKTHTPHLPDFGRYGEICSLDDLLNQLAPSKKRE